MIIEQTRESDTAEIVALYQKVARIPGGLSRLESEVSQAYVRDFITHSIRSGIALVARVDQHLVGEMHAYTPDLHCFSHIMSELTIAVDPEYQGQGIGKRLFCDFMQKVTSNKKITRVELFARESNRSAIAFYQKMGLKIEGKLVNRIQNIDKSLEADIIMGWTRDSGFKAIAPE